MLSSEVENIPTETRLVHPEKAPSPMLVTEVGISTETRLMHSRKA